MAVALYVSAASNGVKLAILFTSIVGLALIMMFMILGFLGVWFRIRKDQDRPLMALLFLSVAFGFGCSISVTVFGYHTLGSVNCNFRNVSTVLLGISKGLYYLFLHRRGSLVQYSGNANKHAFRASFVMAWLYMIFYVLNIAIPGVVIILGDVFIPSVNAAFCAFTFSTNTLQFMALFLEVVLSFLNVYLFSAPLRQHLREVQNLSSMSGNQVALAEVLKRNSRATNLSIAFTLVQLIVGWLLSNVTAVKSGDAGWTFAGTALSVLDLMVGSMCLVYVMMNAWEYPASMRRLADTLRSRSGKTSVGNADTQKQGASQGASQTGENV